MEGEFRVLLVVELSRILHRNDTLIVDCKRNTRFINRVSQRAEFYILGIRVTRDQRSNHSSFRQIFFWRKGRIVSDRSFIHVNHLDNTEEGITHISRIILILNVNRHIVNFLDLFVVKFRPIRHIDNNSPVASFILLHRGFEERISTRFICVLKGSFQALRMSNFKVFVSNQIAHDFITGQRIFFHRHRQDLRRVVTIRIVAIFDADFMAAFTHAYFALVALTYFDASIAFAFRNDIRRFRNVLNLEGNCCRIR